MTTLRVHFTGRVQGVGFRYQTKRLATGFEVTGTVRNLPDGRVELLATGEKTEVQAFLREITEESDLAHHIKETQTETLPPQIFSGFNIL